MEKTVSKVAEEMQDPTTKETPKKDTEVKNLSGVPEASKLPTSFEITRKGLDNVAAEIETLVSNKYLKIALFQLINDNLRPM